MKTVEAIKSYCSTICDENELKGYRPVRKGITFYRTIFRICNKLRHMVKRARPMTIQLLEQIETIVNLQKQKEMVTWVTMLGGFHMVLCKSNLVPLMHVHDSVHNLTRSDSDMQKVSWLSQPGGQRRTNTENSSTQPAGSR